MATKQDIEAKVKSVAIFRAAAVDHKAKLTLLQTELEQSDVFQQIVTVRKLISTTKTVLTDLENELRTAALYYFQEHEDKKPHPGVTVKMFGTLRYNTDAMLDWAIEHRHSQVLKLNASAFKKLANAIDVPGVVKAKEPRVTIARDLSKYDGEPDAPPTP